MPRTARVAPGGIVYHVLNRAVARLPLFEKPADYEAFEKVLAETFEKHPTRILSYCVMPNHWHFLAYPREDDELTRFFRWMTHTHTMRWHAHHKTEGTGHLYQGRFKSFPVQSDNHFLTVARYVEQNALRAGLVERAEEWKWSSVWRRHHGEGDSLLSRWPIPMPDRWAQTVNRLQPRSDVEAVRLCVRKGAPFGSERWVTQSAVRLGLQSTLRPRGRPRKQ